MVVKVRTELLRKAGRRWDGWRNAGSDPAVRDGRGGGRVVGVEARHHEATALTRTDSIDR